MPRFLKELKENQRTKNNKFDTVKTQDCQKNQMDQEKNILQQIVERERE
jgi:hypothetical protein